MRAFLGHVRFSSIKEALREAQITYSESGNTSAVLVWNDDLKDMDYFRHLKPWQVVNRIPSINVMCRKASFARLIERISHFYPELYTFSPKSYILPFKNADFIRSLSKNDRTYIVKPDSGSLGEGIALIQPGVEFYPDDTLAVAQEYIESILIDDTKFDLRVYALVSSVNPLRVHVYRDGLARFCSEPANSDSIYSHFTNVTLNRDNPDMEEISQISRLISDTFPRLQKEFGVDINKLWEKIDEVIALSIIASYNYIKKGEEWQCPGSYYSRCFQILGFDILLDRNFEPHVLEVNYRPSLDYYRAPERRMKVRMIADALSIVSPGNCVQSAVLSQKWAWDSRSWASFIGNSSEIQSSINKNRKSAMKSGKFVKVFPSKIPERQIWNDVIKKVSSFPVELMPGFKRPHKMNKGGEF